MKNAFIFLVLLGIAMANTPETRILQARAGYVGCDVQYIHDWIDAREGCAGEAEVPVADFSSYLDDIDDDYADLQEAADEGSRITFGAMSLELGGDAVKLIGKIVEDALDHKNQAFFACIREDEKPLMDVRDDCRYDAMQEEKGAAKDYVNEELDAANVLMADLDAKGVDTSKMEAVIGKGEALVDDIDPGYESGDTSEIQALHLRHSRLVFLFRAEQIVATIDYAEPIIEGGSNDNKDEILERGRTLRDDIKELIDECGYSEDVEDNFQYSVQNAECWSEGFELYAEFNSIRTLILEGA
ncbi:MAG: hypothetical protein V1827_03490 [Candidatus Micrarchaeota archaeon]